MNSYLEYLISKFIKKMHFKAIYNSNIHKSSYVGAGSHIVNVEIGKYSYVGYDCEIINTKIGSFCSLGSNLKIGKASHSMNWVSTSPVFNKNRNCLNKKFSNFSFDPFRTTVIGSDVWFGDNILVKSGVSIGNGAVVGMGSVVTKDIPSFQIWGGNPAKFIKYRFEIATTEILSDIKWWEWDDQKIQEHSIYFTDIKAFINSVKNSKIRYYKPAVLNVIKYPEPRFSSELI